MLNDSFFAGDETTFFRFRHLLSNPLAEDGVKMASQGPGCTKRRRSVGSWVEAVLTPAVAGYHAVLRKREVRVAVRAALIHSVLCLQAWGLRIGGPSARANLWRDSRTVWQAGRASLMITSGRPTAPEASYTGCCGAWESHFLAAMIGGSGAV